MEPSEQLVLNRWQVRILAESLRQAEAFIAQRQEDEADGFVVRLNLRQALEILHADGLKVARGVC